VSALAGHAVAIYAESYGLGDSTLKIRVSVRAHKFKKHD